MNNTSEPRKRGRPRSPVEKRRSERVVSFVTVEELKQISRLSAEKQQAVSAIVHELIARGLASAPPGEPPEDAQH